MSGGGATWWTTHRNVKRFRGGLEFKAHRLLHDSTLGLRVIKEKYRGACGLLTGAFRNDAVPDADTEISGDVRSSALFVTFQENTYRAPARIVFPRNM